MFLNWLTWESDTKLVHIMKPIVPFGFRNWRENDDFAGSVADLGPGHIEVYWLRP